MEIHDAGDGRFFVRIDKGEEVMARLVAFARERGVECAWVQGIGGVGRTRLAYLDPATREYVPHDFDGSYELVSFTGNLGILDGEPFLHAHAVISDAQCRALGGHVLAMEIDVTGEFWVRTGEGRIERADRPDLGIKEQRFVRP